MKRNLIALAGCCFAAAAACGQYLVELHINPLGAGNDGREYVEIQAAPGFNFNGWRLIVLEGEGAGAGTVDQNIDLTGFVAGSNGLLLIRDSAAVLVPAPDPATSVVVRDFVPDIENGGNTFILGFGPFPAVGTDLDLNNDGVIDTLPAGFTAVDAVAYKGSASDLEYADDFGGVNLGNFTGFTPDALYRVYSADCSTPLVWVGGDLQGSDPGPYNFDDARSFGFLETELEASATILTPGSRNVCLPFGVPVGACCIGGICRVTPRDYCIDILGGEYQGDGTSCDFTLCLIPLRRGACCTATGCVFTSEPECVLLGGVFQGVDVGCVPSPCPEAFGACCTATGCVQLARVTCEAGGGRFLGLGLTCEQVECGRLDAPFISEILVNPPGSNDGNEGIELQAPPGFQFNGYSFVVIEGDAVGGVGPAGTVDIRLSLNGIVAGSNGLVLIRDSAGVLLPPPAPETTLVIVPTLPDIENGSNTYVLGYGIFPASVGTDLDADNDGTLDAPLSGFYTVDAVSYVNGDDGGLEYADDLGGTALGDLGTYTPDFLYRILNCDGTAPERSVAGLLDGWAGGDLLGVLPGPFLVDPFEYFGFDLVGFDILTGSIDLGTPNFRYCPPPTCLRGDSNGDDLINFDDIECYVSALVGASAWQACSAAPDAEYVCRNDINGDLVVDFNDIDGMVACLIGGVCP